ncbi:hypothetical protein RCT21_25710 [Escherichia marmotae]|uniref:hypothetical protein n=1 Tax=Escherichia TaxID=561 RepID=UPI001F4E4225|nr:MULTISPECIES: hypothetical protein [Escherichia]EJI6646708.1 hypothetical protein [Escherichia coli]MCU7294477.1 hypothetical protein [Escherichia albertii]MCZ8925100.1 hypothetical protein [Escherichia albertii]MCZ9154413.1 hypothetical protein [Escherichia albertii]MEC9630367.1 hypothetical protein [Escherichia marmotae]
MNILLTLLYSVVWLVCTILGKVAPESVARAWCEYHLEGMSILRYTYRSLAKAAEMREGKVPLYRLFSYLEGLAHYLGYRSGDEKLESGFLRLFLWHLCAKGHALGALMEMEARVCKYNPWVYGWRDGWTQCVYIDRNEYFECDFE